MEIKSKAYESQKHFGYSGGTFWESETPHGKFYVSLAVPSTMKAECDRHIILFHFIDLGVTFIDVNAERYEFVRQCRRENRPNDLMVAALGWLLQHHDPTWIIEWWTQVKTNAVTEGMLLKQEEIRKALGCACE